MAAEIKRALVEDAALVAPLFNAYRMFYGQHSNLSAAESFITERLQNNQSVIFLAFVDGKAVGFTQLYPIYSSVGLKNAWLLNDLYVTESQRGKHIGTALLNVAKGHGRETNSGWLMLQTSVTNHAAQRAYESNGWLKDKEYDVYTVSLV